MNQRTFAENIRILMVYELHIPIFSFSILREKTKLMGIAQFYTFNLRKFMMIQKVGV